MSRKRAKETLSLDAFKSGMEAAGIFTTTANEKTLDEAPDAYKPKDMILAQISETVEVKEFLRPIYNFKSAE
jgi:RNA-splicing ligase RtcB